MTPPLRAVVLSAALLVVVAGCSQPAAPPQQTPSTSANVTPTQSAPCCSPPSPTASEATTQVLPDGRSPVFITSIDATHRKLTFDLIIFLTGQAAKDEWKKEGNTGDGPPNDYLIVNNNPKLRTLPVSSSASITYNDPNNSFAPTSVSLAGLKGPFKYRPFWITVTGGTITKIEEQFVP